MTPQKQEEMEAALKHFMLSDEDLEIKCYKILDNERLINTILYLSNEGGNIFELERLTRIFGVLKDVLNTNIDQNFLYNLGKILKCMTSKKFKGRTPQETITKYYIDKDKLLANLELIILELEKKQKLIDEENAKYKKKPSSGKGGSIKNLYKKNAKSESEILAERQSKCFNHVHGEFTSNMDPYQIYNTSCRWNRWRYCWSFYS